MRHARAQQFAPSDQGRELEERGREDAAAAGAWLKAAGIVPDHALVSAAVRAVATYESVATAADWSIAPTLSPGLYTASPETALDLIRESPGSARTVIVVGHNPTIAYLAQLLSDGDGNTDAADRMAAGFPPSALAVFTYDGDWSDLDVGSCTITGFHMGVA